MEPKRRERRVIAAAGAAALVAVGLNIAFSAVAAHRRRKRRGERRKTLDLRCCVPSTGNWIRTLELVHGTRF
jgi:hypothetical protein